MQYITLLPRNQSFHRQITSHEKDGAVSGAGQWRGRQDSCNRLNWGALDNASSAPQLSLLQLPIIYYPFVDMLCMLNGNICDRYGNGPISCTISTTYATEEMSSLCDCIVFKLLLQKLLAWNVQFKEICDELNDVVCLTQKMFLLQMARFT